MGRSLSLTVNHTEMMKSIKDITNRFDALIETVEDPGHARVLTSRRKMTEGERKERTRLRRLAKEKNDPSLRPSAHVQGWTVANFLRDKGRDPFNYPEAEFRDIQEMMQNAIGDALYDAYRTNRPQKDRVKRILIATAKELVELVVTNIEKGGLGKNKRAYMFRKIRAYDAGNSTRKYGRPPPYGVFSGRFLEGIRWAWFRGEPKNISGASSPVR